MRLSNDAIAVSHETARRSEASAIPPRAKASWLPCYGSVKRLHEKPDLARTEAMIYDVGEIGKINGKPIYYYVMEKVMPMPKDYTFRDRMTNLLAIISKTVLKDRDFLRRVKRQINEPSKSSRIKKVVEKKAEQISEEIEYSASKLVYWIWDWFKTNKIFVKENWLTLLVEEIMMKYLTGRTDLHPGNLGMTGNGELRYFDPSYSEHTSAINIGGDIIGLDTSSPPEY